MEYVYDMASCAKHTTYNINSASGKKRECIHTHQQKTFRKIRLLYDFCYAKFIWFGNCGVNDFHFSPFIWSSYAITIPSLFLPTPPPFLSAIFLYHRHTFVVFTFTLRKNDKATQFMFHNKSSIKCYSISMVWYQIIPRTHHHHTVPVATAKKLSNFLSN